MGLRSHARGGTVTLEPGAQFSVLHFLTCKVGSPSPLVGCCGSSRLIPEDQTSKVGVTLYPFSGCSGSLIGFVSGGAGPQQAGRSHPASRLPVSGTRAADVGVECWEGPADGYLPAMLWKEFPCWRRQTASRFSGP